MTGEMNTIDAADSSAAAQECARHTQGVGCGWLPETSRRNNCNCSTEKQAGRARIVAVVWSGPGSRPQTQGDSIMSNQDKKAESTQSATSSCAARPATPSKASPVPGPWEVYRWGLDDEAVEILGPEGQSIADLSEREEEAEAPPVSFVEVLANARLIAAAPDLLAACERVLEDLEGVGWGEVQGSDAEAWLVETEKALRAAIAKARGRRTPAGRTVRRTETMKTYERVREQGTRETVAGNPADRIAAIRRIVAEGQYAVVDRTMIDLFTASDIVQVYDALNAANQDRFASMPAPKMGEIAFRLLA